jgi:hypothetical protein
MKVYVQMATQKIRESSCRLAVNSLVSQCDRLTVYANDYSARPKWVPKNVIWLIGSENGGDRGAMGKLYIRRVSRDAVYITVDDDFYYPDDFIERMTEAIMRYNKRAVVCIHGILFKPGEVKDLMRDRQATHTYIDGVLRDSPVHLVATGAMAIHGSQLKKIIARLVDAPEHTYRAVDPWISVLFQKERIPAYSIANARGWMRRTVDKPSWPTIRNMSRKQRYQDKINIMSEIKNWQTFVLEGERNGYSIAIMAHRKRDEFIGHLKKRIGGNPRVVYERGAGRADTGYRAWKNAARNVAFHIVIQDDAIVMPDLRDWIDEHFDLLSKHPVSLYLQGDKMQMRDVYNAAIARGASWVELKSLYWGVAVSLPAGIIEQMLAYYEDFKIPSYDSRIDQFLHKIKMPILYPVPCPVDHRIDTPSLIWSETERHQPSRKAIVYAGNIGNRNWNDKIYSNTSVRKIEG